MCDALTNALVAANTFSVRNTNNNTVINQECNADTALEAFSEFCQIPVPKQGSICDINNYSGDSNWLYTGLQNGSVTSIPQLPMFWSSAPILAHNTSGNYVDTGIVPTLTQFPLRYFVISSQSPYIVLGLPSTGVVSIGNTSIVGSQIVASYGDGFLRSVGLPNTAIWYSRPPFLALSASGNIMLVDTWFWTTLNQRWTFMDLGFIETFGAKVVSNGSTRSVVWYGATSATEAKLSIWTTSDPATVDLTLRFQQTFPIPNQTAGFGVTVRKPFLCISTDQRFVLFASLSTTNIWALNAVPLVDGLNATLFNLDLVASGHWDTFYGDQAPTELVRAVTAVILGNPGSGTCYLTIANNFTNQLMNIALLTPPITAFDSNASGFSFVDSDVTGQVASTCSGSQLFVRPPNTTQFVTTAIPSGFPITSSLQRAAWIFNISAHSIIWMTDNGITMYRADPNMATSWQTNIQLYNSQQQIQDIGSQSLNTADWNPPANAQWPLGAITRTVPKLATLPFDLYSIHNRYQLQIKSSSANDPIFSIPTIRHITASTLSRANDYFILSKASKIRLYSDANIQAVDAQGNVTWQSNMHDGVSTNANFTEVTIGRPWTSPNGLYLIDFNQTNSIYIMTYYPWNNILFRDYGLTNSGVQFNSLTSRATFVGTTCN